MIMWLRSGIIMKPSPVRVTLALKHICMLLKIMRR